MFLEEFFWHETPAVHQVDDKSPLFLELLGLEFVPVQLHDPLEFASDQLVGGSIYPCVLEYEWVQGVLLERVGGLIRLVELDGEVADVEWAEGVLTLL